MNSSLSQEIRSRAMWCHLSGLTWLLLKVVSPLLFYGVSFFYKTWLPIMGNLFSLWMIADLFLPYIIPITVWRLNRNLHPFVDTAGKATVNFIFSITIFIVSIMVAGIFMIGATCGLFMSSISSGAGSALFFALLLIITLPILLILLFHIGATIYAAFRAYRGEVYSYPMTIKFLR